MLDWLRFMTLQYVDPSTSAKHHNIFLVVYIINRWGALRHPPHAYAAGDGKGNKQNFE
jgi:hypothetical protein